MKQKGFAPIFLILGIVGVMVIIVGGITAVDKFEQWCTHRGEDRSNVDKSGQRGNMQSYTEAPTDADIVASKDLKPNPTAIYITSNPVDLSQIEKISKFRSCEAHDYAGYNFDGQKESDRSMKHYFMPKAVFNHSNDKVKISSPVDGEVVSLIPPTADYNPGWGRGGFLGISPKADPNVMVEIAHMNIDSSIKLGEEIKAGQFLGYAAVPEGNDFDFHVRSLDKQNPQKNYRHIFDSIFNHMSAEVLADYAKYGITKEMMFFTKEFRDKNPCGFPPDLPTTKPEGYANVKSTPEDWVYLK